MQLNKVSESQNPKVTFQKDGKWFFWNETWSDCFGPFDTEEAASDGCNLYARVEVEGNATQSEILQWWDLLAMGLSWSD